MFVALIITLVILGVVALLVNKIPMDGTILSIINIVFILIAILAITDAVGLTHFGVFTTFNVR